MTDLPLNPDSNPVLTPAGAPALDCDCCGKAYLYQQCSDPSQTIYVDEDLAAPAIIYQDKCWSPVSGPHIPAPVGTISNVELITADTGTRCCICETCEGESIPVDGLSVTVTFSGLTILTHDCAECSVADGRGYLRLATPSSPVQINGLSLSGTLFCNTYSITWTDALPSYASPLGAFEPHWTAIVNANGECNDESADDVSVVVDARDVVLSISIGTTTTYIQVAVTDRIFVSDFATIPTASLCAGASVVIPNLDLICQGAHFAWGGIATVTIEPEGF